MANKRVLIVEDELIQSILLEKMMTELGFKVVGKAKTGESAIRLAKEFNPDFITMDIFLQDDIDGIEATKAIQEVSSIPVIYISGNTDSYNFERAKNTSYIDFLSKPVNKTTLKAILTKLREEFAEV
ncbi:MAG: response regulator [Balneolaceae bacterium]|nr:response regulator [Balneolaceae bacterium]MCH8548243.1 response regulator [Balneolaceae bacterium]